MIFLIDRDEKEDPEIVQIQQRLGDKAEVRVLQKRELENYLLCPRALAELIRLKLQNKEKGSEITPPIEQEVSAKISEVADSLKRATFEKRVVKSLCHPRIPARNSILDNTSGESVQKRLEAEFDRMIVELEATKSKIVEVCKQLSESVDRDWLSNRLCVVQGDILLDEVCKAYGVRFIKVRDSARLARLMDIGEIDTEIQGHIHDIGRRNYYS